MNFFPPREDIPIAFLLQSIRTTPRVHQPQKRQAHLWCAYREGPQVVAGEQDLDTAPQGVSNFHSVGTDRSEIKYSQTNTAEWREHYIKKAQKPSGASCGRWLLMPGNGGYWLLLAITGYYYFESKCLFQRRSLWKRFSKLSTVLDLAGHNPRLADLLGGDPPPTQGCAGNPVLTPPSTAAFLNSTSHEQQEGVGRV